MKRVTLNAIKHHIRVVLKGGSICKYLQVPFFYCKYRFFVPGTIQNEIYDEKNQLTSADTKNKLLQVLASTVFLLQVQFFCTSYHTK